MSKEAAPLPLSRLLRIDDIKNAADGEVSVTNAEMSAIASLLELRALDGLAFAYCLRPLGNGRLGLSGHLKARVTQTCVVTLDPVESTLDVPVEAAFWPEAMIAALEQSAEDPAGPFDWPEPIKDGKIDLGPLIYETLATALDPYPKREGASFEWSQGTEPGPDTRSGPFAALGELKRR